MKHTSILKRKTGVGLVECIVGLALFAIITASVITIFLASRNQIEKQNKTHKLDLLSNNILSIYEASETFADFSRMMNTNLGINVGSPAPQTDTVPLGTGSGAGSIPVALPYQKIVVNNQVASFANSEGGSVLSFNVGYTNNKLTEGDNGDIPADKYTRQNYTQMVFGGGIRQKVAVFPNNYKLTVYKDDMHNKKGMKFQIQNKAQAFFVGMIDDSALDNTWKTYEINTLSDFEEYLLDNGYYLKCLERDSHKEPNSYRHRVYNSKWDLIGHWEDCGKDDEGAEPKAYDNFVDYFFQVYDGTQTGADSKSAKALTDESGNNLYYCITFTYDYEEAMDKSGGTCVTKIDTDAIKGTANPEKMKMSLANATVRYASAAKCPNFEGFTSELKNTNGNTFTGDWHFFGWVYYRTANSVGSHLESASDSLFANTYTTYNHYLPKTDAYKSIYYALKKDNKIHLMNLDGDPMFSFDTTGKTDPLANEACVFENVEITKKYKNDDWQLFYKKGSMPQKQLQKIVFDNNIATVYDTNGQKFIRFIYKNGKFNADLAAVKTGEFKDFFTVSGNTATPKTEYQGDIWFGCDNFDGAYRIMTQFEDNDPIFVSHADNFEIIGAVEDNDLSFGVIGQASGGSVDSETYFLTCGLADSERKLIIKLTYTNLAKVKQTDDEAYIEPRMTVWSIDKDKITSTDYDALETLTEGSDVRLEHSYRKG